MDHKHYFLRGIQASGKSTFAKELLDKYHNVYFRVNKDDLRKAFYNNNFSKPNEALVNQLEEDMIRAAVAQDKKIIWDNTHLESKHLKRKETLEQELGIEFEILNFKVSLEEALERNKVRGYPISNKVIVKSFEKYFSPEVKLNSPVISKSKKNAFIIDLDGTLAFRVTDRTWYDWDRVGEDDVNKSLLRIIHLLREHYHIIFLSGRDGSATEITSDWLKNIGFDVKKDDNLSLYLRSKDDSRKDTEVKKEIYNEHLKEHFNIIGVFDDRLSVCKMWHFDLELPVYRFGDPTSNF